MGLVLAAILDVKRPCSHAAATTPLNLLNHKIDLYNQIQVLQSENAQEAYDLAMVGPQRQIPMCVCGTRDLRRNLIPSRLERYT